MNTLKTCVLSLMHKTSFVAKCRHKIWRDRGLQKILSDICLPWAEASGGRNSQEHLNDNFDDFLEAECRLACNTETLGSHGLMGLPHFPGPYFQETHKVLIVNIQKRQLCCGSGKNYIVKYTQDLLSRIKDFTRVLSQDKQGRSVGLGEGGRQVLRQFSLTTQK